MNDIDIYYERRGTGSPLVIIGGLANDITDNKLFIDALAERYDVIAFDNRGVGRTDKPDAPYSMKQMANDTAGLLTKLHIKCTNVLGISMGGRIALALVLDHPEFVNKLMLVSTGPRAVRTWRRSLLFAFSRLPFFRNSQRQPRYAFRRQLVASSSYDCTDRLGEIHAETLVLHGRKDELAPFTLAESMQQAIPNATLVLFNGGHLFPYFQRKQFIDAVVKFLG